MNLLHLKEYQGGSLRAEAGAGRFDPNSSSDGYVEVMRNLVEVEAEGIGPPQPERGAAVDLASRTTKRASTKKRSA